jgi:predicted phosphodiesterase
MKRASFMAFLGAFVLAPPVLAGGRITKGPWMQHVTPTSAIVRVEVDPPAPVSLEVGLSAAVGSTDAGAGSLIESREVRALHTILVKGLEPDTRYPFTVRAHGAPKYGAITTAPADVSGSAFRFLVYGDNRSDDAAHAAVVRAMVTSASSFLVNTGDMVENGGSATQWQTFFDIEAPLTRERPIFAVVGNHELVDGAGAEYVRYFGPAELPRAVVARAPAITGIPLHDAGVPLSLDQLSGTFRWSNARFFLINGMVSYTSGPTRTWLDQVLTESDAEPGLVWRVVVVHHGLRSSGPHGDNKLLADANVAELLRAHKVDLVLSGHDHIYERGFADGLPYLVSGGGGAPVYRVKKAGPTSRRYESVRHFVEASVSSAAIQFVATRPDGSTVERCALRKGDGWDCDAEKADAGRAGESPSTSSASPSGADSARSSSRCGCRTAGRDGETSTHGAALALLLASAAAGLLRARRATSRSVR